MGITEKIDAEIITAQKTGDNFKRDTLRFLKSSLKNAQIDLKAKSLSDEQATQIIAREIKHRKESVESYKIAGKEDLAADETKEIEILGAYLPDQMSEDEIIKCVEEYLKANSASADKIGQVIGALAAQLRGKADMSLVSRIVREKIGL